MVENAAKFMHNRDYPCRLLYLLILVIGACLYIYLHNPGLGHESRQLSARYQKYKYKKIQFICRLLRNIN